MSKINEVDKMCINMKKDINRLDRWVRHYKIYAIKLNYLKILKIIYKIGYVFLPYVMAGGIVGGFFTCLGVTPFYRDKRRDELDILKEIDSYGNVRYEESYDKFNDSENSILYYDKWSSIGGGIYKRNIYRYNVGNVDDDGIEKIINGSCINSLEEVFGDPIEVMEEIGNNLSDKDMDEAYLEARIYNKDMNDYVIISEPVNENIGFTLLYLVFTLLVDILLLALPNEHNSLLLLKKYINDIKREYPCVSKEDLIRKLKIRKDNYERLMR